jgi:hypothetical protein
MFAALLLSSPATAAPDLDALEQGFKAAISGYITGRIYLDPAKMTRPNSDELKPHRVFILTKR